MDYQIICGDALAELRELADASVDCMITDPPYGIGYQSSWRIDTSQRKPKIDNDERPFIWFLYDAFRVLKDNSPLVVFCEWRFQDVFKMAIETAGFTVKSQAIWDRGWHGMGDLNGSFAPMHDVIWFATKGRFEFPGDRPKSVLRFQRIAAEALIHPNEKPESLMRYLVETLTTPNQIVCDPFCGSGSVVAAAVSKGRRCIGIDISERFVELTERRLAELQVDLFV